MLITQVKVFFVLFGGMQKEESLKSEN